MYFRGRERVCKHRTVCLSVRTAKSLIWQFRKQLQPRAEDRREFASFE